MRQETKGTWFVAYGAVYSQLGNGEVVRVAIMDRDEKGTWPTERDANTNYIVRLQNMAVCREITEENLSEALKKIE